MDVLSIQFFCFILLKKIVASNVGYFQKSMNEISTKWYITIEIEMMMEMYCKVNETV